MADSTTKVRILNARCGFVAVFKPKSMKKDDGTQTEPKYSLSIMIPKEGKTKKETREREAMIETIREAVKVAAADGKTRYPKVKKFKSPLRDGDTDETYSDREEYNGMYFLSASTKDKPGVINRRGEPLDPEDFGSGDWAHVTVNFRAYSVNGNHTVSCFLSNVLMVKKGESLGGRKAEASEDFEDMIDEDADDDYQDDDYQDEKLRKKSKKSRDEDEDDEDEDEDEDDEDEKPRKKSKKSRDEDDEDEDEKPRKRRKVVDDADEDDEDEKPRKKSASKKAIKGKGRKRPSVDEDDD